MYPFLKPRSRAKSNPTLSFDYISPPLDSKRWTTLSNATESCLLSGKCRISITLDDALPMTRQDCLRLCSSKSLIYP